ncbi:Cytochrome c, mono-and diheme variants [Lishizhenia tianjinensis]|uniref:Cytochrome c, mono-and diheme variants n=1 Tax=Lishizhenia tianjinensis TaxID=477690 RepID=A0A1I7B4D9_9FLAO|nr:cytochrome c [Lishizhenia tianjinensis]SFT82011.1 Cytochrome c, mono-and diheme variants [Lishizhenia tianjinensis]
MKRTFKAISTYSIAAITGMVVLASCVTDPDSPGLEYMPDMYRSPAVEPYVDYGRVQGAEDMEKKMVQSAMTPPAGAIPYYGTEAAHVEVMLPYHRLAPATGDVTHGLYGWEKEDSLGSEYNAAVADKNPLTLASKEEADAMFKAGKHLYETKCMHCHGEKGDGNGPMVTSGAYAGVPDYKTKTDLADGQVFYSIYYGKGAMGAHASLLNNEQIWTLVHYVNKFRFDDYMKNLPAAGEAPVAAPAAVDSTVVVEDVHAEEAHH